MYGNSLLANNLNNMAMQAYIKADTLANGKEGWVKSNIGNLYNNVGLYNLAENFLKESLNLDNESQYAHDRLSSALVNIKDEDDKFTKILENIAI
jgi:tetratricopeptide (TPR) repeat protein